METKKNYRRVTLRSSIKIETTVEAPTLGFKLKRAGVNPIIKGLRRAAAAAGTSHEQQQISRLRSSRFNFGPTYKAIYSKFPTNHRYVTGSVREYFVAV